MKTLLSITLIILTFSLSAQEKPLSAFDHLIGSTWISEGTQLGGHEGKTVKEFTTGLDGNIIKVKTFTTDPKTLEFGLRNEGVRIFNNQANTLEFYEFNKLGGVTKGKVIIDGKDLHYEYEYGELILRDSWVFINQDEYSYTVASWKNEKVDQEYHKSTFIRKK